MPLELPAAKRRWLFFVLWATAFSLIFWKPLFGLFQLAMRDDTYSYVLLIPFIFAWLLYADGRQSAPAPGISLWSALVFFVPAILLSFLPPSCSSCSPSSILSIYSASWVLFIIAGFILILGSHKARSSAFSLAFLVFVIPIPDFLLFKVIYWLQAGSAAVASVLFDLSGAPVLREGFVFRLPRISIEVAQECSGIRSSMALLILALVLAHFAFRPFWKKATFIVAGLSMMLIKNGVRIVSLTLLANYVNPNFLYGNLHHQGGIVFFLIGLLLLFPVFWFLRRGEASAVSQPLPSSE